MSSGGLRLGQTGPMTPAAVFTIAAEPWDGPDGAALRAAQQGELDLRYGSGDHEPGAKPTAADSTVFLVARDELAQPLGCGGLRRLDAGSGEVKRMYVVPQRRGTGVATALLRALEQQARTLGWTVLRLETGTAQPDAMRFYEREGYTAIENYGPYAGEPLSRCYQRTL